MSDLIQKFIEAQLSLRAKAPEPIEPFRKKGVKMDARVVEPEKEIAESGDSLGDRFDHIVTKHPKNKKIVIQYLQDLIDTILADED
jgi:hypothetical protein